MRIPVSQSNRSTITLEIHLDINSIIVYFKDPRPGPKRCIVGFLQEKFDLLLCQHDCRFFGME